MVRPKTPRDFKEPFWTTFTHFQQKAKKRVCVSENKLTSISVTSNSVSFQRTFCEAQAAGIHVSQCKIFIRNKTIRQTVLTKGTNIQ